jgi:hypothetical protein
MMSPSSDSKNPLSSFLGNAFLVAVPVALIVMLGIVGFSFVGGMKKETKKDEATVAASATGPVSSRRWWGRPDIGFCDRPGGDGLG